jgi:hypothetical protein
LKPNPILKVLSSIRANRVRALLMGGQACVFYGAAEFSLLANYEDRRYWIPLKKELENRRHARISRNWLLTESSRRRVSISSERS